MRKLGLLSQPDPGRIYPDPTGTVSPSDVGIRKASDKDRVKKKRGNSRHNQVRPESGHTEAEKTTDGQTNRERTKVLKLRESENRDPKCINAHITVNFEDVIGEPEDVRSSDCFWLKYRSCYTCCKNFIYSCSSLVCGCPLATVYGCLFACLTFPNVWILTPFSKTCEICCISISRLAKHCAFCLIGAPCSGSGQLFRAFNPKEKKRNLIGKRTAKVTFSETIRTKRIPARKSADKSKPLTRFQIIRQVTAMRHMSVR